MAKFKVGDVVRVNVEKLLDKSSPLTDIPLVVLSCEDDDFTARPLNKKQRLPREYGAGEWDYDLFERDAFLTAARKIKSNAKIQNR